MCPASTIRRLNVACGVVQAPNKKQKRIRGVEGVFPTESCSTMDTIFFSSSCLCISLLTRRKDHDLKQDQSWLVRFGPCGDVQHLKKRVSNPGSGVAVGVALFWLRFIFQFVWEHPPPRIKTKSGNFGNFGVLQLNNSISKQGPNITDCCRGRCGPEAY